MMDGTSAGLWMILHDLGSSRYALIVEASMRLDVSGDSLP